jgi:hypothetical protein
VTETRVRPAWEAAVSRDLTREDFDSTVMKGLSCGGFVQVLF